MALASATKLGPYEIVSPIGAGGMGEVYLARDTRLQRTVAIKVLPESLAHDSDRLQRFEHEARVLSTVNHPNLLAIFDVGAQGSVRFLVSEFLEGRTLRERMNGGPLQQRKLADYALQLANGLAAAHDKGIVHRDLKPENIFITDDERVKILDFGLAKQSTLSSSFSGGSATITTPAATTPGTVMGTVGYMSPEQVRGDLIDHRSDIFSFGAILYEMISVRRAFKGDSGVETMNAILKEDPPELDPLQTKVSPAFDRIVRHCLEKNPANRFQSARDLGFALGALSGSDSTPSLTTARRPSLPWWLIAAAAALALAILTLLIYQFRRQAPPLAERLEFAIPLQNEAGHLAISPDGRMLAFVSPDEATGANMLCVQRVGSSKITVLPGTESATYPFWSPDDNYVAFFADGRLKKIPASGGAPQVLASAFAARGGSWGRRGVIVYSPSVAGWLWSVNADGSNAAPLTEKIFSTASSGSHRWPLFLPDGDHFLFWSGSFTNASDDRKSGIYLSSFSARDAKLLMPAHSNAGYGNGKLFFVAEKNSLRSINLDVAHGTTSGEARVVAEEIGFHPSTYWGAFTVADNGTVIYNPTAGSALSVLTWFDRAGKELGHIGEPGVLANPTLSPDGNRLTVDVTDIKASNVDVWIKDFRHNTESRFTFDPAEDVAGVWSRDGSNIAFRSNQVQQSLFAKQAQGLGAAKLIFAFKSGENSNDIVPNSWSPDDKQILSSFQQISTGSSLVLISVADGKSTPFLHSQASATNGQISPDGKWVAYSSNESGDWQIYVTTFPEAAGKWQVSRGGGREPRWRGDSKEIFYIGPGDFITAVPVNDEGAFSSGNPVPLFQSHGRAQISSTDLFTYDVAKDGQRFLMNRYFKPPRIAPLQIILNAAAEPRE